MTTVTSATSLKRIGLVRSTNLPSSWSQSILTHSLASCETIYMIGYCATGFTFFYSDGSNQTVGADFGGASSVLNFTNANSLTSIDSYGGAILDVVKICGGLLGGCVVAGNPAGRTLTFQVYLASSWTIAAFWGSFSTWSGYSCLDNFGIDYYDEAESPSKL